MTIILDNLPTIAICSLFRNSLQTIPTMVADREKWDYPQHKIWHICVEGDSTDGTDKALAQLAANNNRYINIKRDFSTLHYPSVIHPVRMLVLSTSWNIALENAIARNADYILILDSDLTTKPSLLKTLLSHKKDVVAPLLLLEGTDRFRDTWGYSSDNTNFIERYPYHSNFKKGLFKADTVGVPFINAKIIKEGARFSKENEIRGLCTDITSRGYSIYIDGNSAVWHPQIKPVIGYG